SPDGIEMTSTVLVISLTSEIDATSTVIAVSSEQAVDVTSTESPDVTQMTSTVVAISSTQAADVTSTVLPVESTSVIVMETSSESSGAIEITSTVLVISSTSEIDATSTVISVSSEQAVDVTSTESPDVTQMTSTVVAISSSQAADVTSTESPDATEMSSTVIAVSSMQVVDASSTGVALNPSTISPSLSTVMTASFSQAADVTSTESPDATEMSTSTGVAMNPSTISPSLPTVMTASLSQAADITSTGVIMGPSTILPSPSTDSIVINPGYSTVNLPSAPTTTLTDQLPTSSAIAPTPSTPGQAIVSSTQSPDPCSTNPCDVNADCTVVSTSYSCSCRTGFSGSGITCTDINECATTSGICGNNVCENRFGSYVCKCPDGSFLVGNICEEALSYQLQFTILEGASYSDDLQDQTSQTYQTLQQNLENDVKENFQASAQSSNFFGVYLNGLSPGNAQSSGGTVIASFTIFVNYSASDVTTDLLETAFNNGLSQQTVGSTSNRVLGSGYVLATSTDGVNFSPSMDNIVVDINECSQSVAKCGEGQMCENYPGTYRCYCNSPGTYLVGGNCEDILSYEGGFVVINREFKINYNDTNSIEYLQFAEEVAEVVKEYYMKTQFAPNLVGVRVIDLYPGSVGVKYIALFNPTTTGVTSSTLRSELEPELDIVNNEKFIGSLQLTKIDGENALTFSDYDECNPPENIHIPDCGPNAMCTNLDSTYNCTCLEGYIGDGVNCAALPELLQADRDDVMKVKYMISTLLVFLALCIIFSIVFIILSIQQILERRRFYRLSKKVERIELQSNNGYTDSITVPSYQRSAALSNYYEY
ncbi:3-oxoacyl-[acyl-carrier- ] synthase, mitochondrial, partial [Paramuricea clavata]